MKAMMLEKYTEPLRMVDLSLPTVGPRDVLVRVRACGVCRTDVKIRDGLVAAPIVTLPHVPGHEVAGEVVETGKEVADFGVGDKVVVYLYLTCGECVHCRTGRENLCLNLKRVGFEVRGGFAEYIVVPARQLLRIGNDVPFEHAAVLTDAVVVPYHAIRQQAKIQVGDVVLIVGIGGLGIHAVQIAKAAGAEIIAADVLDDKLELARAYGADHLINARKTDPLAIIRALTDGVGVDAVIENVGSAESMSWSLPATKKGGKLVIVGYSPGKPFPCDSMAMHYNEWEILGSRLSTKQDLADVIELVKRGLIKPLVTRRFALEAVNEALDELAEDKILGRAVIIP
jgi:2-desacetyl-2-hydroxyethyl bacteriochlorophyllide A dehydrogenase